LEPSDDFTFVTARGRQFRLYAHSYLGFGQDYVQNSLLGATTGEEDPCYPEGYSRKSPSGWLIKGSGKLKACKANIFDSALRSSAKAPGSYDKALPIRGKFVLTENFFYVQNDHSLKLEDAGQIGVSNLDTAGETVCGKAMQPSAAEVANMESGKADAGSPKHCFGLAYQAVLLQTLQASALPGTTVQIAHQVNGGDVDWVLGAALVHYQEAHMNVSTDDSFLKPIIVMLTLFGISALLWRTCKRPIQKNLLLNRSPRQGGSPHAKAARIGAPAE